MRSKWKVLAPVDFTDATEGSVQHAIDVANALAAELVLLHVVDRRWHKLSGRIVWPSNAFSAENLGLDIRRVVLSGAIPETIARYADFIDANLLLMTSRKRQWWNSFRKRSTTDAVMELSRQPVCVTQAADVDADFRFRSRRILCVVGLDGKDAPVLQRAQQIANRCGAELILLHVVPEISEGLLHYAAAGGGRPLSTQRAKERVRALAVGLSVPVKTSVMTGEPAKCIGLSAREHAADLVIASRAHTTHLEPTLSRLDCPLLTISLNDGMPQGSSGEDLAVAGTRMAAHAGLCL